MTDVNLPDPILIKRTPALLRLANSVMREPIVAVDTESNSLYAYQEQVCLIQFSTPRADFLVDPLSLDDLSPLGPLFSSPKIEKIFHAAEYDLICLKRDFGFEFANIFDTMLAARILGMEAIGLGSLLEAEFGVHADKKYQRANWGQRPLPRHLLKYAQQDTHYLIPLRNRLRAGLKENKLWPLAEEDFERLCEAEASANGDKGDDFWRIRGSYDLPPQKAAVLFELHQYRDQVARKVNRPLFKVIGDRTLLAIAERCPSSLEDLRDLPGMSRGQIERHGEALLAAVEAGLQAEPLHPPRSPRPNENFLERVESLRSWRKSTALKMGVKSDVVLPRDLLYAIAELNPRHSEGLANILRDVPWRLERFGAQILVILHGNGKVGE
jgi:ribonuclease D